MLNRAYSLLTVKSIDDEQRVVRGTASTPEVDRIGDIVESTGLSFRNPTPLLLFHDHTRPVGTVKFDPPTKSGLTFEARIPKVSESGTLRDRVEDAWASIKHGLIAAVSIGFKPSMDAIEQIKGGGLRFMKAQVLELSLVTVAANQSAVITTFKSIDAPFLAASGAGQEHEHVGRPGVAGRSVVKARQDKSMKTITEQIKEFENTRAAKVARMTELMTAAGEKGETLDEAQEQEHEGLEADVKKIDAHLKRLDVQEEIAKATARPVNGSSSTEASTSRGGNGHSVIHVKDNAPPGIGFARVVLCKAAAYLSQGARTPMDFAKGWYPHDLRVQDFIKGAVPAATTTDAVWAGPLVDTTNLTSEFVEFLRPATVVGKFGTGGIPSLVRVPFNVRILGQTNGGNAYWVGQGAPKPLTSFAFNATTLLFTKVATIAVITKETARFSSPSAEQLVRNALRDAVVERLDIDFIDPTTSAVAGVNPASITNGLTAQSSAGTSADNARTDIRALLAAFIGTNQNVTGLVLIMPSTVALSLSLMQNTLGQPEFAGLSMTGGTLLGIPVITSQYAANQSGAGNMVIAVNTSGVALADDGQVTVDASDQTSLQMLDNPTNNSATATATSLVSMFQTNSIALRAERFINWAVIRTGSVVYMDDVNWGSIGSP